MSSRSILGILSAAAICGLLVTGCSGGGSPTAPQPFAPPPGASAVITGEVTSTAGGISSAPASLRTFGSSKGLADRDRPAPGLRAPSLDRTYAADRTGSGYTVRVQGTGIATTTDGNGLFTLGGVPTGNQVLVFEGLSGSAGLAIEQIHDGEQIEIKVRVQGSTATLESMTRSAEDDSAPTLDPGALELELAPDEWNLNFAHSSGTVAAFIRGDGIDQIDLDSIEMSGDNLAAEPLAATSARLRGDHVRAEFPKSAVIDLLQDPQPGSTHEITIRFTAGDGAESLELTAEIVVEDDDEGNNDDGNDDGEDDDETLDDLSLEVSPSTWNLNYPKSSGTVTVFIRGEGLSHIDLDTITLAGDNPEAEPIPASFARLEGNHVRARFPKNQLIDLLDEPARGTRHTVTVAFDDDEGGSHELTAEIRVTGNG